MMHVLSSAMISSERVRKAVFLWCVLLLLVSPNVFANVRPVSTPEQDAKSLRKQASRFLKRGEYDKAEKAFTLAIQQDPKDTELKLGLAQMYVKLRRLNDAYKLAFPIAQADPKNSHAYAIVGTIALGAGQFGEARAILNTAISIDRDEALAWASLGLLEFYENDLAKSVEYLREAVFRDGSEPDYLFALAQATGRAEKYVEAADAYRKFLRYSRDTDKERRDRIVGIIKFLEYLGQRSSVYSLGGRDDVKIPFKFSNQRPVVKVKLNGKDELHDFVFDTGSGMSVISEKTAKRLGIDPVTKGGKGTGIGGDGKFDIVFGFIRELEIGGASIRNIPVYIRKFHNDNDEIDGYIGLALISKFLTTVDYGTQTFSLQRVRNLDARAENGEIAPPTDGLSMPLRLTSSGFLSGEVMIADHSEPVNFIVDTGASTTVLSKELMKNHAFRELESQGTVHVIGIAGITYGVASFTVPTIKFGASVQNDISAIALDLDVINQNSGYIQSGILGGNFLSKYKVIFDFQRSLVTLSPSVSRVTVDPAPLVQ